MVHKHFLSKLFLILICELSFIFTYSQSQSAEDYFYSGTQAFDSDNFFQAISYFSRAIELDPNHYASYTMRGISYLMLEEKDSSYLYKAIQDFTTVIKLNENRWSVYNAYYYRGFAFQSKGLFDYAILEYSHAIELIPDQNSRKDVTEFTLDLSQTYFKQGQCYLEIKSFESAVEDFTKALSIDPKNSSIYYQRGIANLYLKSYQDGINDFTEYIKLAPLDPGAYYNRGIAYGSIKSYDNAIRDFTFTINLKPDHDKAYYNRGYTYHLLNEISKACSDWEKALMLGNKEADVQLNLWCK